MSRRTSLSGATAAPDDIDAIAASWVARTASGALRASERAALDAWLAADIEHATAYERALAAYDTAGSWASDPEILAMRREALAFEHTQRDWRPWALAAAACLLVAIVGVWGFSDLGRTGLQSEQIASVRATAPEAPRDHYATRVGERLTATLSDGSVLTLNTASEVRIHYSEQSRRIELLRGQAFFSVAHRPDWPFLVEAAGQSVRALGTQFEVRLNGSKMEVVLVEGRVAIGQTRAVSSGDLSHAVELQAGERLVAARASYDVAPVDTAAVTAWRSGRMLFAATPLREAIAEVNRYRATPLVIEEESVGALEISGAFRTADAASFGQALGAIVPVEEVTLTDGRTVLRRRRANATAP